MFTDSAFDKTLTEHLMIKEMMDDILDKLESIPNENIKGWISDLEDRASKLCQCLKQHFALEEEGGFMQPVLEMNPLCAPTLELLKQEHELFLRQFKTLIANFERAESIKKSDLQPVCHRFKNLIQSLRHHEEKEDQILQETFLRDIGTKD